MYKQILIPIDGSECSELAIQETLNLAQIFSADVSFLMAVDDPLRFIYPSPIVVGYEAELYEAVKQNAIKILDKTLNLAAKKKVNAQKILAERQKAIDAILDAEKDADLVVISTHGRKGVNRIMFGSVAEAAIRSSCIPCLVIRNDPQSKSPVL